MKGHVHHKRRLKNGRPAPMVERAGPYIDEGPDALAELTTDWSPETQARLQEDVERLKVTPPESEDVDH